MYNYPTRAQQAAQASLHARRAARMKLADLKDRRAASQTIQDLLGKSDHKNAPTEEDRPDSVAAATARTLREAEEALRAQAAGGGGGSRRNPMERDYMLAHPEFFADKASQGMGWGPLIPQPAGPPPVAWPSNSAAELNAILNENFPQVPTFQPAGAPEFDMQGVIDKTIADVRGDAPAGEQALPMAGGPPHRVPSGGQEESAPWYQNADIQRAGIGAGIGGLGGLGLGYVMGADSPWEYLGYGAGGAGLGAAGGYFGNRVLDAAKGLIGGGK